MKLPRSGKFWINKNLYYQIPAWGKDWVLYDKTVRVNNFNGNIFLIILSVCFILSVASSAIERIF